MIKFGVVLPTFCGGDVKTLSLDELGDFALEAERLGLDSLWVVDHVLVAQPRYKTTWLEPLTVLSSIAARTKRIKIGTSVLILPLRNIILLAKTLATIDHLSGGRLIVGVGAGWHRGEFDALGVNFSKRGKLMDEQLRILRELLEGKSVTYQGHFHRFSDVKIWPESVQHPPPIWVGGGSMGPNVKLEPVFRRVALLGDGWIARPTGDVKTLVNWWRIIRQYASEVGREEQVKTFAQLNFLLLTNENDETIFNAFSPIVNLSLNEIKCDFIVGNKTEIHERIKKLVDVGVNYFIAWLPGPDYRTLKFIGEELTPSYNP